MPDTGVTAVPEIDPSGLAIALSLVMGSVAMLEQRRRRRAASAAVAVTAWPRTTHRQKLLLVGWDSADWKIIHPLLDAGELPAGAGSLRTGRSQAEEGQIARPREVSP